MGYTTKFKGKFKLDKAANPELTQALLDLWDQRGELWENSDHPDGYCQWILSENGMEIKWDGGEKFYDFILWIRFIAKVLGEYGYKLNGRVYWSGEESFDHGRITAKDNVITWEGSGDNRGGESVCETAKNKPVLEGITYADLLAELQKLTSEQLKHKVIWTGDERGGTVKAFFIQTEDQVCTDEYWEPRAFVIENHENYGMTQEEAEAEPIVSAKGQPYLAVD